jgi:uncharacterized protein YodC (DUF2158 family)
VVRVTVRENREVCELQEFLALTGELMKKVARSTKGRPPMNDQCTSASAHLGTLVQEKAGGPPMHVIAIADLTENHLVRCAWHDETNEVVVGTFRPEDLVDLQIRRSVAPCTAGHMGAP